MSTPMNLLVANRGFARGLLDDYTCRLSYCYKAKDGTIVSAKSRGSEECDHLKDETGVEVMTGQSCKIRKFWSSTNRGLGWRRESSW